MVSRKLQMATTCLNLKNKNLFAVIRITDIRMPKKYACANVTMETEVRASLILWSDAASGYFQAELAFLTAEAWRILLFRFAASLNKVYDNNLR